MEAAKLYTSMNGVLESSVSAYMDMHQIETEKRKRPRRKKKRAASQIAGEAPADGAESRQNLLVQEDEE